jgi:uncharacterized damage-inducible protein DinB
VSIHERLNSTRSHLLSVLEGLNDDQLNWKPDHSTWSIAQVVQHISMVEGAVSKAIVLGLAQESNFAPKEVPLERVLLDRSKKVNAPENLRPSTERKTKAQLEEMLRESHEKFVSAFSGAQDTALLGKTSPPILHPVFGQMSTEQWIESALLHEGRHIEQIEELKKQLS